MAGSPKYKVYDNDGVYVASCKSLEDAAILVGIGYTDRGTVRLGHGPILWTNGVDGNAADSYDGAAHTMAQRESTIHTVAFAQAYRHTENRVARARAARAQDDAQKGVA